MSVYILYDRDTGEIAHVHVDHGDGEIPRERVARFVAGRLDPERLEVRRRALRSSPGGSPRVSIRPPVASGRLRAARGSASR